MSDATGRLTRSIIIRDTNKLIEDKKSRLLEKESGFRQTVREYNAHHELVRIQRGLKLWL